MPLDASKDGHRIDELIVNVHYLMGVLFVFWLGYFLITLLKFNKRSNPAANHTGVTSHWSSWLEIAVVAGEALLLIGFAIPIWAHSVAEFPKEKDSTVIKVVAQQFQWNGWYAGTNGVFASNDRKFVAPDNPLGLDKSDPNYKSNFIVAKDFVVPVNKPVIVYISSLDVIHCFAVRPLRVTQDAIPGMSIPAWFTPVKEGTYEIQCAQLCGNSHYGMKGTVKVVSQAEYDKWVASKTSAGASSAGYE